MSRYPKALKKVRTKIFLSAKKSRLEGYEILIRDSDYGKNSWCRERDSNPHGETPLDFKSNVSAIPPPRRKESLSLNDYGILEAWSGFAPPYKVLQTSA